MFLSSTLFCHLAATSFYYKNRFVSPTLFSSPLISTVWADGSDLLVESNSGKVLRVLLRRTECAFGRRFINVYWEK